MLALWLVMAVCAMLWCRYRLRRRVLEPPEYPGALPLLGHLPLLLGDGCDVLATVKEVSRHCLKTGDATVLHFGFHKDYLIVDPEDALTVANICLEKNFMYYFAKPWLGNGLLTSKVPIWKNHRKLLNPTFSQHVMYSYMDVFNRQARRLVGQVSRHTRGNFDHQPYMCRNALETICMTAMGLDLTGDTVIDNNYMKAVDEVLVLFQKRFKTPWLYFDFTFKCSSLKKKQDNCIEILHNVSNGVIRRRKRENKKKPSDQRANHNISVAKCKPFLELLLELSEQQVLFTEEEVREHVDTIIVSGYETIASVMCFTLVLIGSYKQVQERLLSELKDVFGDTDRDVAREDLSRLVYLEAVIKESMRIYPVAPIVARRIDKDVKLKNYTLLSGNTCIISQYGIHHHSMWGEDAGEFKPERWLDPSTLPDNANTFLAFGLGRRNCIGKTYAMTSMKTTLAHFVRRYKVAADHSKMALKMEVLLKPVSGHCISVERRMF